MAVGSGYVDSYDPTKIRQQIIVVVREDWTVSCFDALFVHLWDKSVAYKTRHLERLSDFFSLSSVSIFIAPFSLRSNSSGVVIVGADMQPRAREANDFRRGLRFDPIDTSAMDPADVKLMKQAHERDQREQELKFKSQIEEDALASLEHFSMYALDSASGESFCMLDGCALLLFHLYDQRNNIKNRCWLLV